MDLWGISATTCRPSPPRSTQFIDISFFLGMVFWMYMLKVPRSNRKWFIGECYPMSEMWRRHHTTTRPIECGLRCGLEMWRLSQRGQTRGHWQTGLLLYGESQASSGAALSRGPGGFDGKGWKVATSKPLCGYFNSRRASINQVLSI